MVLPVPLPEHLTVRPVLDGDADALIALIGAAYAEHPGCVLDLPGVDADLVRPRTTFDTAGGELWVVATEREELVGCCGWAPATAPEDPSPAIELKRLYVAAAERGQGLGRWLVSEVERVARAHGATRVVLWSDDRFADAHRLYELLGYTRRPETRRLHDPSDTTELHFERRLTG
jgi:putative acetyltransferase